MPATTMAIIATTAATNAILAEQRAEQAARCGVEIRNFDSKNASVSDMQYYSYCVQTLYPEKHETPLLYKGLISGLLVALVIGAFIGFRNGKSWGLLDHTMDCVMGGVMAMSGFAALCLIGTGVYYIFN